MNTIREILNNKQKNIFKEYVEEICSHCANKENNNDLCEIRQTIEGTVKCVNYEKCMKNKCKTCEDSRKCFEGK